MARDPAGRSMHERNATETREMGEADRRNSTEKAAPYLIVVAVLFVVLVVVLIATR